MYFINNDNRCFWSSIPAFLSIVFYVCFFIFLISMIRESPNMILFMVLMIICFILATTFLFMCVYISKIYKENNKIKEMIDDRISKTYDTVMNNKE